MVVVVVVVDSWPFSKGCSAAFSKAPEPLSLFQG